jgi:serine phosphatase RsbU (regulator of sigma subunit)
MGVRASAEQLRQTLHTMPARSRLWLLLAIFLTYASLTLWSDASAPKSGFWIAAWAWLSGLIGVAYAVVWLGYRSLLPIAVVLNLLGPALLYRWMPPRGEIRPLSVEEAGLLQTRLQILAFVRTVTTLLAYGAFLNLLRIEGRRSIGAHTEIRLAREIHAGLVPLILGVQGGFEWYGVSRPSGAVGGDLVDVVQPAGQQWIACVADVSGHGVAAGVLMGMFKTALHSACRATANPADVLTQVNEVLTPLKQSNMFVTVAVLSGSGGDEDQMEYALAGHPSLAHVSAHGGEARWVGEAQLAVGFLDSHPYSATSLRVSRGDRIVIVTDGLIEVFDQHERELGMDGLLRIIKTAARHEALSDMANEVFAAAARHGTQADDQSLIIVRRAYAAP